MSSFIATPPLADAASSSCGKDLSCRDKTYALHLKLVAIAAILVASLIGVVLPLVTRNYRNSNFYFTGRCFAAGVILATGFVHMLPDAFNSLTNSCLPAHPWSKFPFAGFLAMVAAIFTLVADASASAFYINRESKSGGEKPDGQAAGDSMELESSNPAGNPRTARSHIHPHEHHSPKRSMGLESRAQIIRQRVIAQVLELGIVAHSVIIGISMGTSQSPCTIRPLVAALCFHQMFEGMALGGSIAQAGFRNLSAAVMAFFFCVTTPGGIAIGIAISSVYNENSPKALTIEGIFDSLSAGILVYMALVDLIAQDFLSEDLARQPVRQVWAYLALLGGAGAMSLLAVWA
ncbi:hypothetical protein O6H91_04G123900 [Diphasiastrum complanatum]|uniref:Uncharacterized protein n=3 Tax=Diphasiastrum complanatum TaxID=34168 RepID=A0ACC2E1R0_DIPCM|nr:hypothetical protein O6H91_04G123900 [Diphasiastrum complanatum]KAJ7560315.1 hypothetical protein O6H91_04G123900 [Diphasiastrum complanatum]KAJ7560316.1 hypothetical protein O6H91_04G123900 [Diphasiastrum complanatum]